MYSKEEEWEPARDPLHFDKPKIVGVGLGRSFAEAVVRSDPGIGVGLIPCAVGGSPISTWQPGAFYKVTNSHPWDDALRRAKSAIKDGQLKGILWHQGESDSKEGLSDQYEQNLHELIARFRKALNAPEVPFVVGQMGIFEERPWDGFKRQVDQVHQELPTKVEKTAFASAEGLSHKGDEIHFDTDSFRILGQRYFEAWQTIVRENE